MNHQDGKYKKEIRYYIQFFIWIIVAIVIGVVGGIIGTIFHTQIEHAAQANKSIDWLIYLLPLAGIVIVFTYHRFGVRQDPGTNLILKSTHTDSKVPFRLIPLIIISTVITHLFGASAGREGAALQVGGSLGSTLGNILKFNDQDRRITVITGMAAVFSAMFGTPVAATVFSMEVVSVGNLQYAAFVPAIIASIIAEYVTFKMGGHKTIYVVDLNHKLSLDYLVRVSILGIIVGIVAILFCILMHKTAQLLKKYFENAYLRIVVGASIIVVFTIIIGNRDYNGAGTGMIEQSLGQPIVWYAFIIKMIFTAISIGSGFKGGEIVPTLFIGATLGNMLSSILGLPFGLSAAVAMIALFCGVVNAPLSSIILAVELFGTGNISYFAVACAISYVISRYYSLYSAQIIVQDKMMQKDIFKKAE